MNVMAMTKGLYFWAVRASAEIQSEGMSKKPSAGVRITLGFVLGTALNGLIFGVEALLAKRLPLTPILDHIGYFSFALFGVVQSIWQVPLILWLAFKGHKNFVLGAVIAFVLTILLNLIWFYFL